MIFKGYLSYLSARYPGGLAALHRDLGDPEAAAFLGRIFLAMSYYDLGPLLRAVQIAAKAEKVPLASFIRDRAAASAKIDVPGVYAPLLKSGSVEAMARSLPRVFSRYFEGVTGEVLEGTTAQPRALEFRFGGLPEPMLGWYVWSNEGFIGESLALAGARSPTFEVRELAPDGERDGIPLRSLVTRVKW